MPKTTRGVQGMGEHLTSKQRAVTPGDLNMLDYFWSQKEDVERYSSWPEIQEDLERRFPEIAVAWRSYQAARRTLTAVIKHAYSEAEYSNE
jgi:hypothetical protein